VRQLPTRYDPDAVGRHVTKRSIAERENTMWRYRELLPVRDPASIISLGETVTPLLSAPRLAAFFGVRELLVKDESRLPTGSFKARGMALAISKANELGIRRVAAPTAGNAGGAMAAYAARVPVAIGDFMILDAVHDSGGLAVAVPEHRIAPWMRKAIGLEGLSICPEAAVCLGALESLLARGDVRPDERIVVFNTGAAQKYPEAVCEVIPLIDIRQPVAWDRI